MAPTPTPISASLWGPSLQGSQAVVPPAPAPVDPPAPAPVFMAPPMVPSQAPPPAAPNMDPLIQALAHQTTQSGPRFGMDFVSILVIVLLTALTVYCITLSGRITQLERQCAALVGALATKT